METDCCKGSRRNNNQGVMKKYKTGMTTFAVAAALASTAIAQDQSSQATNQNSSSQASAQNASSGQSEPWKAAQKEEFFRASDLIGKSAQDKQGEKVGSLKDVVFNQKGEIFALVDVGSSRWAAVPLELLQMRSAKGDKNLVINTSKQALSSAPVVTKDQWGALNNPSFTKGIYSYYKVQSPAQAGAMGGSSDVGGSTGGRGSSDQNPPASSGASSSGASQSSSGSSDQPSQQDRSSQQSPDTK